MKRIAVWGLLAAGLVFGAVDVGADTRDTRARRFTATLEGFNEVPAVSTPARGQLVALVDEVNETMQFILQYDDLQAPITQSHIHMAQPSVNGAIVVWLCGTAANPGPAGTQVCPQSGTVSGTITGANIQTVSAQGIATGEFSEFLKALRSGVAYANIHTAQSPTGEIRGQVETLNIFRR